MGVLAGSGDVWGVGVLGGCLGVLGRSWGFLGGVGVLGGCWENPGSKKEFPLILGLSLAYSRLILGLF